MNKKQSLVNKYPLVTAFVALVIAFVLLLTIKTDGTVLQNLRQEVPLTILTLGLVVAIGGFKLIKFKSNGLGFTFRKSIIYLIPGILVASSTIFAVISAHRALQPNLILLILEGVFFYSLLGFFEEGMFRGVILQALLAKLGKTRRGLFSAVIIGGVIFGFVHILLGWFQSGVDLSVLGLLQALVKTLSAGMAGYFFGAIYLKTKNLWGIAIVHGLSDFLLMIGNLMFTGSNSVSYVSSDPKQAMTTLLINTIFILIYIPLVVGATKQLKSLALPQLGFYRENWK
ncbi:CPBP family intramembrane glutamic endopeptidase [Pediococcus argentinicus]|uniref:CPBP family intramembrane glutamic endopeptidase n=1 Tax=Pediococcus argentinicus TaxID=480391 RepID=UPI003390255A